MMTMRRNETLMKEDVSFPGNFSFYGNFSLPPSPLDETWFRTLLIIFFVAIFIVCVTGNLLVILVITCHRKTRSNVNFFLANLAAADLSVGVFCVIPRLSLYITPHWFLGRVMCKLYFFVLTASYACSIFILSVITVERYLAISRPLQTRHYTQSRLLRTLIITCVWITSAAYATPFLFVSDLRRGAPDEYFCVAMQNNLKVFYVMVDFFLLYVIPLVLMTAVYLKIAVMLWRSSSKAAAGQRSIYYAPGQSGVHGSGTGIGWSFRRSRTSKGGSLRSPTWMMVGDQVDKNGMSRLQRSLFSGAMVRDGNQRGLPIQEETTYSPEVAAVITDGGDKTERRGNSYTIPSSSSGGSGTSNSCGCIKTRRRTADKAEIEEESNNVSSISNCIRLSEMPTRFPAFNSRMSAGNVDQKTVTQINRNPLAHRRKVVRLLMIMVGSFAICMLPHHVRLQWQQWSSVDNYNDAMMYLTPICTLLFYFNSALNPFLYALISDRFRQTVTEIDWFMLRRIKNLSKRGRL